MKKSFLYRAEEEKNVYCGLSQQATARTTTFVQEVVEPSFLLNFLLKQSWEEASKRDMGRKGWVFEEAGTVYFNSLILKKPFRHLYFQ